jgi:histidinol-phosphate aminotransferase
MRPHLTWDSVNILALAAANASLKDPDQVPNGRRLNTRTKQFVLDEIKSLGFQHIPSQANFIMIDLKQPVRPLIDSMSKLGVQVGRAFPSLPNHMRVTIGKQAEMEAFMSAFKKVAASQSTTRRA